MNSDFPQQTVSSLTLPFPGPLTLGELLDRAFRLYRAHFGPLLMTAAIVLVPLGIVSALLTGSYMVGYMNLINQMMVLDQTNPSPDELGGILGPLMGYLGVFLLFGLIGGLIQGLVSLSLTAQGLAILRGDSLTLAESFRMGGRRLGAFVGKWIVEGLVIVAASFVALLFFMCLIFGVAMAVGGAFALFDGFGATEPSPIAMAGLVILVIIFYFFVFLFLLGPSLYFFARYGLATTGIVDQEWRAVESLRESWRLTKGLSWRSIGYFFLLFTLVTLVIGLPVGVAQNMVTLALGTDLTNGQMLGVITAIFTAISTILQIFWHPLYVAAAILYYYDIRIRQENYDLELRIEQMESRPQLDSIDNFAATTATHLAA
ncbi:MAG: hypothetical protein AAF702_06180 [Chloroflexota bacterium]